MAAPASAEIDYLIAWQVQHQGHTLDNAHSYTTIQCDDSKTLFVTGHLFKTSVPNQQFRAQYKLDGSAPIVVPSATFTTSADGTGDFAFSVEGITSGSHTVIVEINLVSSNLCYFMDNNAANGGSGVPVTCP